MNVEPTSQRPEERFATIQRDYVGLMARVVHAFAPEPSDRDDLFQEIRVAIWQALPQFREGAKLSTYVYRIAFNCAINWRRSRSRYDRKLQDYAHVVPEPGAGLPPRIRAQLEWLYSQIQQLAPLDRTVILLSLDRLNYAEIAEITGLSEANVGVRLHRTKAQLAAASEKIKNEL